jgi:hypothetical protein
MESLVRVCYGYYNESHINEYYIVDSFGYWMNGILKGILAI